MESCGIRTLSNSQAKAQVIYKAEWIKFGVILGLRSEIDREGTMRKFQNGDEQRVQ
jgi:hypothetical protein